MTIGNLFVVHARTLYARPQSPQNSKREFERRVRSSSRVKAVQRQVEFQLREGSSSWTSSGA
jgi:hypothetical protein